MKFKVSYVASPVGPQRSVANVLLAEKAAPERRSEAHLSFVLYQGCGFNFVTDGEEGEPAEGSLLCALPVSFKQRPGIPGRGAGSLWSPPLGGIKTL